MSRCQTCIHSIPIGVTSDIYTDGFEQVCCDCKTKVKNVNDQEKYVLDEVDKVRVLANDYISSLEHFEKLKSIINSKEAL